MNFLTASLWGTEDKLTDEERQILSNDLQKVIDQYFDRNTDLTIDVTPINEGFSVCFLFGANRIKRCKKINY